MSERRKSHERIDWPALRERYRTTTLGLRQISDDAGVSERAVMARSRAEAWPALRLAYQEETAAKIQRETQDRQVQQQVDSLTTVKTVGRAVLTRFARLVNANAVELNVTDFVNVAKLVLLLEGVLPAESVDVRMRQLVAKPPQELDDDQLDAELAELADRYLRQRSSEGSDPGEGAA
jgi:hypothetical protein